MHSMPSGNGTATETQSRPQLLVRTSQFFKKVSHLRTSRRKSEIRQQNAACDRSARSMDLGPKAPSKFEGRTHHESLDQERVSGESPPYDVSLPSPPSGLPRTNHVPMPTAAPPAPVADGLPSTMDPLPAHEARQSIPPITTTQSTSSVTRDADESRPASVPDTSSLSISSSLPSIESRAQTLPSRSFSISEVPRGDAQQSATVGASMRRALAPRLATLPPPMMAGYNAEGRARLTPSIVARQPPMPILHLPTLPPPTPSQPVRPGRGRAPLRSIPALPMQGPSDADQDADHENASLEEEEEEEDGEEHAESASGEGHEGDSSGDEDDQEYVDAAPRQPSASAGQLRLAPLPHVDTSGFSVSFADASSSHTQRTPHAQAGSSLDYFTSKSPEPTFSPMRTPRPADFHSHGQDIPQLRSVPMPSTPGSPRPGLYHLGSRSMVDLLSTRKERDKIISPKLGHALSRKKPPAPAAEGNPPPTQAEPAAPEPESPDDVISSPMLRRRRSLPVYEPSSDPPPYPDLQFQRRSQRPRIAPRDEEGCEQLPPYSNAIHVVGVMPRKMEFTQPGVQAKDRKWRRVYCVLEGTMFLVYKAPPAGSAVSAIEQWWENKVGVGDITSVDVAAMTTSGIRVSAVRERPREDASERPQKIVEEREPSTANGGGEPGSSRPSSPHPPPTKSRLNLGSRLLHRQRSKSATRLGSNNSNSSSRVSIDRPSASQSHSSGAHARRSMDTLGSSRTSNVSSAMSHMTTSTTVTTPSPTATSPVSSSDSTSRFSRSRLLSHTHSDSKEKEKEEEYVPDPKDLIRKYSLQHAESGLASDYVKRKNVIRVRMEGEQFLLQAKDVASVIDWIEGIQMGTNVALDLDERPMPRGPIFPRRRRRRVRRVEPSATGS